VRRLASIALLAAVAAVPACGDEAPERPQPPPRELAIGITEPNPAFVWPASHKPLTQPVARWRDALSRMAPHRYRLMLNWAGLQPQAELPADLDMPADGCMRGIAPCAGFAGVREQLEALAAAQREQPGRWQAMVVISGTPDWAAAPATGCRQRMLRPESRIVRTGAVPAYRRLVAAVLAAAADAGAEVRHWSAWNEPNQPSNLSPQRARCDAGAPTRAVAPYVRLARALRAELAAAPGEQELALGELAGYAIPGPRRTAVGEFIDALPRDVACAGTVWSQHVYVSTDEADPIPAALESLDRHGCERRHEIWITETGVGAPVDGPDPPRGTPAECAAMQDALERWYAMPRVTAAFQYTLRDDPVYPTGLVSADLSHPYGVLEAWTAWAGDREPAGRPPVAAC
jgi:hypothetical protein